MDFNQKSRRALFTQSLIGRWTPRIICFVLLLLGAAVIAVNYFHPPPAHRDIKTEKMIRDFYNSKQQKILEITETKNDSKIIGYCLLEPYESRLTERANGIVSANEFLSAIELPSIEERWHIVFQTETRFFISEFTEFEIRLVSPKPLFPNKTSCLQSNKMILSKSTQGSITLIYPGEK